MTMTAAFSAGALASTLLAAALVVAGVSCGSSEPNVPGGAAGGGNGGAGPSGGGGTSLAGTGGITSVAGSGAVAGVGGTALGGAGGGGASADAGAGGATTAGRGGAPGAGSSGGGAAGASGGNGGATNCMTPPAPGPLIGWAAEGSGTTGGGNAAPVVVTSATELTNALRDATPRVIHVASNLTGSFSIGSNKTVVGVCGAQIRGNIGISNVSNVIVRNLKVVGNNCSDSPQECGGGADAIAVSSGAHHVWFDHLDVSDGSDGNLDITNGSDFVTVSWTKFSYSTRRSDPAAGASGHRFSNLIGAADAVAGDANRLNVTFHHNWWADNIDQRMPRTRAGQIHVFNNLFTASGNSYCTNAGYDAKLLVQNNVYRGVNQPFTVTTFPDMSQHNGNMRVQGNDTPGSTSVAAPTGAGFTPPYEFTLDPTSALEAAIRSGAGPH